jgi:hypothetical protein
MSSLSYYASLLFLLIASTYLVAVYAMGLAFGISPLCSVLNNSLILFSFFVALGLEFFITLRFFRQKRRWTLIALIAVVILLLFANLSFLEDYVACDNLGGSSYGADIYGLPG